MAWRRPWLYVALSLLPAGQSLFLDAMYDRRPSTESFRDWVVAEPHLGILFVQPSLGSIAWMLLSAFALWGLLLNPGRSWWKRNNPWGSRWALGMVLVCALTCAPLFWVRRINAGVTSSLVLILMTSWCISGLSVASALLTNPLPFLWAAEDLRGGWGTGVPRRTWVALAVLPLAPEILPLVAQNVDWAASLFKLQGGTLSPWSQGLLSALRAADNPYYWNAVAVALVPMYWLIVETRSGLGEAFALFLRLGLRRLATLYGWVLMFSGISFVLFIASQPSLDDGKKGLPAGLFTLVRATVTAALSIPWWFGLRRLVRQALSERRG